MKLGRAKETYELTSAQLEAKTEHPSSATNWSVHSAQLECTTRKNHAKRNSYEEVMEDTSWHIYNEPDGDIRSLIGSFRPNQEEPSNKSNCFGFPTHQRLAANWNHDQIQFGLRVIDFSNRVNRSFPDLEIGALIGGFRQNQKDLGDEPNCFGIWTQSGSFLNWNQSNTGFGLKDIQLLNQVILHLPYLEAHGFNQLQTRLWRPGETSKHSGDPSNHPGEPFIIIPCTSTHRIRRILFCSHFPYLAPRAFTLGAINHQRLYPQRHDILGLLSVYFDVLSCTRPHQISQIIQKLHLPFLDPFAIKIQRLLSHQDCCVLGHLYDDQNVPEQLTYPLKPTRYKGDIIFPYLQRFPLNSSNG